MNLVKNLKLLAVALAAIGSIGFLGPVVNADESNPTINDVVSDNSAVKPEKTPRNLLGTGGIVTTMINLLMYIVGLISVVMMIVGGLKYVTSGGDAGKVGEAKNTIMYSIIGLVVAILSFAIVNFVVTQFITS